MSRYFITGTDTGVGKTLAAAVLTLALKAQYWKPVQSGLQDDISDRDFIQQMAGLSDAHFFPTNYALKASLSPDQAAALENISIDLNQCILPSTTQPLVVEGAGGVYVPLNQNICILDLMKKLDLPVVIVARGTLGTINHTLLTIDVLRQRGLLIHGVIFSGDLNLENQKAIENWGNVRTLLHIPHFKKLTSCVLQKWIEENSEAIANKFS